MTWNCSSRTNSHPEWQHRPSEAGTGRNRLRAHRERTGPKLPGYPATKHRRPNHPTLEPERKDEEEWARYRERKVFPLNMRNDAKR